MNWYLIKLVFSVISDKVKHTPQFDEQLRLISSQNLEEAFHKAKIIGLRNQDSFVNTDGKLVKWKFEAIIEILLIDEFKDGMQLYSSTHETEDSIQYLSFIEKKSNYLHGKSQLQTLQL